MYILNINITLQFSTVYTLLLNCLFSTHCRASQNQSPAFYESALITGGTWHFKIKEFEGFFCSMFC